jgi:cytochrome c biogenesis protein CcmG/thiol:disulfide interchange protein DsbE
MKRLLYILPLIAFAVLAGVLFWNLSRPQNGALPSALIDKPAPSTTLPALDAGSRGFGPADLRAGHVTVVNVWASWCAPCRIEAPALATLSQQKGFALYGFVYKDTPEKARAFLNAFGNPFSRIGIDARGRAAIEWGVYGAPETFVIDGKGIVRERFVGALTDEMLRSEVLPAIAQARAAF